MASGTAKPTCCVESENDLHVIVHIMKRQGVLWPDSDNPVQLKNCKSDYGVLEAIPNEIDAAKGTGRTVGFVIDIDTSAEQRWKDVVNAFAKAGVTAPKDPQPAGYIQDLAEFRTRVGLWLMPDNTLNAGKLEHLLETLVPDDDMLIGFAREATAQARDKGAKYLDKDHLKAELHCWLAWQVAPGMPYGNAIKAKYFQDNSPTAAAFIGWFRALYAL